MKNIVTPFRNNLFGSRGGDIQEALNYAEIIFNTLSSTDQIAVRTAFGVLINTIENAVTQSQMPIIELIDERIAKYNFPNDIFSNEIETWMRDNLEDKIIDLVSVSDAIETWMQDNLEDKINDLDLVVRIR